MAKTASTKQDKPLLLSPRAERGSRKTQFLRMTGNTPGIIYGMNAAPVAIALPTAEITKLLATGTHILEATLDGKTEKMLIQQVQYDYLNANIEHIDLLRIDPSKKVHVKVALEFRGTAKGTKEGGILEVQTPEVEIEVSPLAIPGTIRVNIENLELHQIVHAKDIVLPEGAKLLDYADKIICQVRTVKEEVAAVAAEATSTEPEVIGKKKEDEAAEGAAAPAAGATKAAAPAKK